MTFSIDTALVECLRDALPLSAFVETGTFEGDAVELVRPMFDEIHTIEITDAYYRRAAERFATSPGITVIHGDSRQALRSLRRRLAGRSVLYWLDAHWCGGPHAAGVPQCPLLGELEAIGQLNRESVILIDDARLFLATPPKPHDVGEWPRFHEVLRRLSALSPEHELMVINDVIVFFPTTIVGAVADYAHSHGFDLLATMHQLEEIEHERNVLRGAAAERLDALEEKEREIAALARIAHERLETIDRMASAQSGGRVTGTDAGSVNSE